ncbi:MAG: hypothetical protein ACREN6_17745 [Gemmatimonadaceae bacterium]
MRSYSRFRRAVVAAAACLAVLGGCEGSDSHVDGPRGASAFGRYMAIGTGLSMGVQSGGVIYESQLQAWPALLAHAAAPATKFVVLDTVTSEVTAFRLPLLRTPGCQPPLVAPLSFAVDLAGTSISASDSTCAGASDTTTPPTSNLALAGASAWTAINLTPRTVINALTGFSAGDRGRYPLVLGSTQSQVTAMRVSAPTFVSVEFGLSEVLGAATSGLLVAATSYDQSAPYTYVPAEIFAPVFAAIADSVALTNAKVVLLSVPKVSALYALRPAAELAGDSTELASFGITVNANCAASPNFVFTGTLVPTLAAQFAATGTMQGLSCADVPGTADGVVTPADITTLDAVVDAMNAQIGQLAQQNGWAFADLTGVYPPPVSARAPYAAADQLTCLYPYGSFVSLDGIFPSAQGQAAIASVVASAIDAKYGFNIAIGTPSPIGTTAPKLCP